MWTCQRVNTSMNSTFVTAINDLTIQNWTDGND
jgi:hypothetical protein